MSVSRDGQHRRRVAPDVEASRSPEGDWPTLVRTRAVNYYRRHLLKIWESRGGGFYGFVFLITFVYLEVIDLAGDIAALPRARLDLGFLISWFAANLRDAITNLVHAAIWPASWIQRFGVGILSGALLLACYGTYRLIHPTVRRWLTPVDSESPSLAPLAD